MARTHGAYASTRGRTGREDRNRWPVFPTRLRRTGGCAAIAAITALGSIELLGNHRGQLLVVMGATGGRWRLRRAGWRVARRARESPRFAAMRRSAPPRCEEVYDTKAGDVIAALRRVYPEGVDAVLDLVNGRTQFPATPRFSNPEAARLDNSRGERKLVAERKITAHNIWGMRMRFRRRKGRSDRRMLADGAITARIRSIVELDGRGPSAQKLRTGGLRARRNPHLGPVPRRSGPERNRVSSSREVCVIRMTRFRVQPIAESVAEKLNESTAP